MLEEGDTAPPFTVPMVTPEAAAEVDRGSYTAADVDELTLSAALEEGPVVLAFFPGVYSRTCTDELCTFRDWRAELAGIDGQVYGVSADTPWSQLAFIDEYDLNYPLLSGFNNDIVADYGVRSDEGVLAGIANRAVFVLAPDRTVTYTWVVYEPQVLPDTEAIESAVEAAA